MFSKRHYEAIAMVFQDLEPSDKTSPAYAQHAKTVREFADRLRRDNPRFNGERFERACVPGANVKNRTQ